LALPILFASAAAAQFMFGWGKQKESVGAFEFLARK
jgi:hypothetical protein